jgi:hypothetical protein
MKVLVFIISNETKVPDYQHSYTMPHESIYTSHKQLWLQYMNLNPEYSCFFIEYHPEKNGIEGNTIYIQGTESFQPGIREKTIESFSLFLNSDYDFIVRTNLSSLWNFKVLTKYLETLPRANLYSGPYGYHNGIHFASGSGMIITRDIMKLIVEKRKLCDEYNFMDDVDIGYLLNKIGIYPTGNSKTDVLNKEMFQYNPSIYHYRIKFQDRNEEVVIKKKILDLILEDSK